MQWFDRWQTILGSLGLGLMSTFAGVLWPSIQVSGFAMGAVLVALAGASAIHRFFRSRPRTGEIQKLAEPDFMPIKEAGLWLYNNGSQEMRDVMRAGTPSIFPTIADHGAAFVKDAAARGICQLWGRREAGLVMEKVEVENFSAFQSLFGDTQRPIIDLSILRSALPAILAYYRD